MAARRQSIAAGALPRWTILSVTTLSSFMAALDTNIVTIALPAVAKGLSSGISLLGWVVTGYSLATAGFLLQSGKMGDRYGKKKVYLSGFALFGVASALCGLSQDVFQLITFRVIQGVGASILSATTYPLIFESFPTSERGSALGLTSGAWSVGAVAGPVFGGFLASIDWRLIFYVNVPVSAVAILMGIRKIPDWLNTTGQRDRKMNLVSAGLLALTITTAILLLTLFDLVLLPVVIIALSGFIVSELSSKDPLLNRDLLRNRGFVFSAVGLSVTLTAYYGVPFAMSFYFQFIAGFSPLLAGVWLAPVPLALTVSNPVSGRLFDRMRHPAAVSVVGAVILVISLAVLSSIVGSTAPGISAIILLSLIGVGSGMVWAPTLASALKFSGPNLRGIANGTVFTATNISFSISIALVVSVSASTLPAALASRVYLQSLSGLAPSQLALFELGLSRAVLALSAIAALGVPALLLVFREQGKDNRFKAEQQEQQPRPPYDMPPRDEDREDEDEDPFPSVPRGSTLA